MNLEALRARLAAIRSRLETLANPTNEAGETRDLSADESAQFEADLTAAETLTGQIARLEKLTPAAPPLAGPAERSAPPAPNIQTDRNRQPYSLARAIRMRADCREVDGLEREVAQEIERRTGRVANGLMIPTGADEEIRALCRNGQPERRDLTAAGNGAGAVFNAARLPIADLLRNALVLQKLGVQFWTGLRGNFAIPAQTGTGTFYWQTAEGQAKNPSDPAIGQIPFVPKQGIAATRYTRQMLQQSSIDVDAFVENDLAQNAAREIQRVFFNGLLANGEPKGILNNSAITNSPLGANGATPTFATLVGLEGALAANNADMGSLAYVTAPGVASYLKTLPKNPNGQGPYVVEDGLEAGFVTANGQRLLFTGSIPTNLTTGTSTGNTSAIIYGNWSDAIIGMWEGIDMIVNVYSGQLNNQTTVSYHLSVDCQVRQPASFAIASGVKTS